MAGPERLFASYQHAVVCPQCGIVQIGFAAIIKDGEDMSVFCNKCGKPARLENIHQLISKEEECLLCGGTGKYRQPIAGQEGHRVVEKTCPGCPICGEGE